MFLFVHSWEILYARLNGVSYLESALFLVIIWSPTLKMWSIRVKFSWMMYFSICIFLRWCIYLQFSILFIGRIMFWPKTNFPGLFFLVRWYVYCTSKAAAARITIQGSASPSYVSSRLYVHTTLPHNWCILSMVVFACGFLGEAS